MRQMKCTKVKYPLLFSDRMEVTGLEERRPVVCRVKALNRLEASKPSKPTEEIQAIGLLRYLL